MFIVLAALLPLSQGVLHRAAAAKLAPGTVPSRAPAFASQRQGRALLAERSSRRSERRAARQARQESGAAPAAPPAAAPTAAEALPPGWTSEVDPASGRTYYANAGTGASQWESPAAPVVQPPPPPPLEELSPELDARAAVRDDPAFNLPTFDDFRARDKKAEAESAVPETSAAKLEVVQERLLDLLTFDNIDERPADEPRYDWTARIIGRGLPVKSGAYPLPYLQSGHMIMTLTLLLSTSVTYPGFPLTEVPTEYREILQQGMGLTYGINALAAVYARGIAERKQEPVNFWSAKTFLLGGLALDELAKAVPDPLPEYKQRQQRQREPQDTNVL